MGQLAPCCRRPGVTWQRPGSRRLCATLRGGSRSAEGKQTSGAGGMHHVHIMSAPACMGLCAATHAARQAPVSQSGWRR